MKLRKKLIYYINLSVCFNGFRIIFPSIIVLCVLVLFFPLISTGLVYHYFHDTGQFSQYNLYAVWLVDAQECL